MQGYFIVNVAVRRRIVRDLSHGTWVNLSEEAGDRACQRAVGDVSVDSPRLFKDVDVLFGADVLEDLWPHAYGDFAEVRFPQQEHEGA